MNEHELEDMLWDAHSMNRANKVFKKVKKYKDKGMERTEAFKKAYRKQKKKHNKVKK